MKTRSLISIMILVVMSVALVMTACSKDEENNPAGPSGDTGLWANVPAPSGGNFVSEEGCRGGKHRYYTVSGSAISIVQSYGSALESNGWDVFDLGGVELGAGLKATHGNRFLSVDCGISLQKHS